MYSLIIGILALAAGAAAGYVVRKQVAARNVADAEGRAEKILTEAKEKAQETLTEVKNKQQELLLEAKDRSLKIIEESKRDEQSRRQEITEMQRRLEKRESMFDSKLIEVEDKKTKLEERMKQVDDTKAQIAQICEEQVAKLQEIAGLSREDAEARLMTEVEKTSQEALWQMPLADWLLNPDIWV